MKSARIEAAWVGALLAIVVAVYLQYPRYSGGGYTSDLPPGYYGLLTEAFAAGQVSLKLVPDPKLLRLADPYAGPQGASRPHDMSFYRGKFYLYYGPTPALLLSLPWKLLQGRYPNEPTMTATLCLGGVLLGSGWLWSLRRRRFPDLPLPWLLLGIAVVAFGSPVFFLSGNPTFYAVPIAGGYFSLMVMLTMVDRAVRSPSPGFRLGFLALASLAGALAVGARPDYIAVLAALLLPAGWIWFRLPPEDRRKRKSAAWILAAAVVPAAAAGLLLALYNYVRFGNPADFGIQYSMASSSVRDIKLTGPEFIPKNIRLYVFQPAQFVRYFPFFFGGDHPFGIAPHFTLALGALLFPLTLLARTLRRDGPWLIGGLVLVVAGIANLAILSLFFGGEDRYLADFAPAALLAGCLVVFAAAHRPAAGWTLGRRALAAVAAAVALWTVANGTAFAFSRRVAVPWTTALGNAANQAVAVLERIGGVRYGDLHLRLTLPAGMAGTRDPLVTTRISPTMGDIVFATYPDASHVQFGFFHMGAGGPIGDPVPVDFAREHEVSIRLGSLYPPRAHPIFSKWTDADVEAIRRRLEVRLDGALALSAQVNVYESNPDRIEIGANTLAPDVSEPRFRGKIVEVSRDAQPPPAPSNQVPPGPARLRLRFPPEAGGAPQPLISTGVSGRGDLLSIEFLADRRVRFIHDSWGGSDFKTEAILPDELAEHVVEVEMGSLYPPGAAVADDLRRRLAIRLDGHEVLDIERPFNPAPPGTVVFGTNAIRASSAVGMYRGTITTVEPMPSRPRASIADAWGPIRLRLQLPTDAIGLTDPILMTGIQGAADLLYVRYIDAGHVRFGLDHWGIGTTEGPIVRAELAQEHILVLSAPALFPPGSPRANLAPQPPGTTFSVQLDGAEVFSTNREVYPATPAQVTVGRNDLGASTSGPEFSGRIIETRRLEF